MMSVFKRFAVLMALFPYFTTLYVYAMDSDRGIQKKRKARSVTVVSVDDASDFSYIYKQSAKKEEVNQAKKIFAREVVDIVSAECGYMAVADRVGLANSVYSEVFDIDHSGSSEICNMSESPVLSSVVIKKRAEDGKVPAVHLRSISSDYFLPYACKKAAAGVKKKTAPILDVTTTQDSTQTLPDRRAFSDLLDFLASSDFLSDMSHADGYDQDGF